MTQATRATIKGMVGKKILYKDYTGKHIAGIVERPTSYHVHLQYAIFRVNFGHKAFLVSIKDLIPYEQQLTLF